MRSSDWIRPLLTQRFDLEIDLARKTQSMSLGLVDARWDRQEIRTEM